MKDILIKSLSKAAVKDVDKSKRIVTGYFSTFTADPDSDGDIMDKAAFNSTVAMNGPDAANRIWHLFNHSSSSPINKPHVLKVDANGLYFETRFPDTKLSNDTLILYQEGAITEHSIGFRTIKSVENKNTYKRDLTELQLFELSSLSGWGCNQWTPLTGVKSEDEIAVASKRMQRLEKFCKDTTATDETIEMLLLEVKQLNQLIFDLKADTTKPTANVTQPENEKGIDWQTIANQLIKNQFSTP